MSNSIRSFEKRARSVEARHKKLAGGYVTRMDKDGLIHHAPRKRLRLFRPRVLLYPVIAVMVFKVFLLSQMGQPAYEAKLTSLAQGSALERAGAVLMSIDPVTETIAGVIGRTAPL
ncbi:MAG: hypothetical protein KDK26_10805 [Roseivivax sp.]|nr:hypothetical protein [Roseivivax sp.]